MTRTEERLAAALRETAHTVREDSLSPLAVSPARRGRWARRLAPVAAAAAVALIAVLALVLPGGVHKPVGGPPPGSLPPYYVVLGPDGVILVLSTSTRSIVGHVPSPGSRWLPAGVVAAGDGRFVAEYLRTPLGAVVGGTRNQSQTRLYSFRLAADGHATGLSLVHGGVLTGFVPDQAGGSFGSALAVSPDGSRVALAVDPAPPCPPGPNSCPVEIVVINMRTGQHERWEGGLNRSGIAPGITGISWASANGPLDFLAWWCPSRGSSCGFFPHQVHIAQVRTLNLAGRGGSLAQGSVLLGQSARYPDIVAARLVPGHAALAVVVFSSPALGRDGFLRLTIQVINVPLEGHGRPSVLYHRRQVMQLPPAAGLSPDASGRHWLLTISGSNDWIGDPGDGRLHPLPSPHVRAGYVLVVQAGYEAW